MSIIGKYIDRKYISGCQELDETGDVCNAGKEGEWGLTTSGSGVLFWVIKIF